MQKFFQVGIRSAKHHANPLCRTRFVNARKKSRERGGAAWFRDQAQLLPQRALSFQDLFVADQE
jgi:hypothetical protein